MLASLPPLEISLINAVVHTALMLMVAFVTGSIVLRVDPRQRRTLPEVSLIFVAGTLTLIGVYSTLMFRLI